MVPTGCVQDKSIGNESEEARDKNKAYYKEEREKADKLSNLDYEVQQLKYNSSKIPLISKPNKVESKQLSIQEKKLKAIDIMTDSQTYDMSELYYYFKSGVNELTPTPDNPKIDRRIIDEDGLISFKVIPGSSYTKEIDDGFTTYYVKDKNDFEYMIVSIIQGETAFYENGITDTGTFLIEAEKSIKDIYPNADPEICRVGNTHIAILYQDTMDDPMTSIAFIRDGYNNVYVIIMNDMHKHNLSIFNAVMSLELFRSDGYKFINSPYRDKIYLNKIKSVTNMNN
jgi:hypothetical protein